MADTFSDSDRAYMLQALSLAQEAYDVGEVPVGCVFVHESRGVLGQGRNCTNESLNGTRHAEFEVIDQIMAMRPPEISISDYVSDIFPQTDLYVTVEPCVMCAAALRQLAELGIGSNYQAMGGLFRKEAVMMLRRFYVQENEHAPVPKKKASRVLKTNFD
ncbi:hypothetical protein BASA60_010905 [Batrachochytrium salamandrivorans]|nr:hypothetical protein BASA60_010905 [Batrachochytrium salamandrivorans]